MFDLVVLIFGQYAVPLGIALLLIVIFRTIIQIASDVDKRLVATVAAFVVTASAMAQEYDPERTALLPQDVTGPLGTWGYASTTVGELKLIREVLILQTKIAVMALGVASAGIAVSALKKF
jgi:hypothetical protein